MAGFEPQGRPQLRHSFKAFFIACFATLIVLLLGWLLTVRMRMDAQAGLTRDQERAVSEQRYLIKSELGELSATASTLAQMAAGSIKISPEGKAFPNSTLNAEFLNFAKSRQVYDQLRLVGPDGKELINIKRIRARSGTYYFRDTTSEKTRDLSRESWAGDILSLAPGKSLVTGLELKTDENGKLEEPFVPLLRVGAALPVEKGREPAGYVVVDYAAENFFRRLERLDQYLKTTTLIADSQGYWLRGPNASVEWGSVIPARSGNTIAKSDPAVWKDVLKNASGVVTSARGTIVFDTMNLAGDQSVVPTGSSQSWKIMAWLPPSAMMARGEAAAVSVWWWVILAVALVMPATYLMVNDRDQKREASRQKEQARALLQSITDISADGTIAGEAVRDRRGDIQDFRLIFSNPAAGEILKTFEGEDAQDDGVRKFPLFFSSDFFAQCVQVVVTGSRFETEQNTESSLGRRWFRLVVVKLDDGVVLTFSDITRQKFAVHELRQAKESAEVANRVKTQFLTMMGHEIRTPMNGLLGFASLLEKTDLSSEQQEYVSTLRLSGEALLHILDDILDYSHMEYEALHMKSGPVDLKELVTQVSQLFVMALGDRNLELVTRIAPDVPQVIVSDDVRLRQILVNLVGNALKFTDEGFLLIKVVREVREKGDSVVIHVVDSGPGVSPEMIDRLFKPFSQVDSTISRRFGGTGLGLSICKRLVETMGGEIGVNTAPGKGSDFYFSLPIKTPDFSVGKADAARPHISSVGASSRILVVDDDSINRKLIVRMIEKIGAQVEVAESGPQAIQAFQDSTFDLILMDVQMPGMDGLETTKRIREIEEQSGLPRTTISALTANVGNRQQCLQAGMDDFVCKPIRIDDLERLIEKNQV